MNPFERHIREKLQGFRPEAPADAWKRFESRLDDADGFDRVVREKLERHQERYRQGHWRVLRDALDRQGRMLRDIHLARSLEAALLLLLVYALWNLPFGGSSSESSPLVSTGTLRSDALPDQDVATLRESFERTVGTKSSPASIPSTSSESVDAPDNLQHGISPHPSLAEGPLLLHLPLAEGSLPADINVAAITLPTELPSELAPFPVLAALPALEGNRISRSDQSPSPAWPQVNAPRRFRHRISMSLGRDLHHILTPYDHLLSNRGYDQWAGGNSGSFGYTWEGRRWGIRTHVAYHDLGYLPKPFTEVFDGDMQRGYFTESLQTIELNLISVDLQVSGSLLRLGAWNLYAVTGIGAHMAFLANYDRRQEYLPGTDPLPGGEIPQPTRPSKTSQKRFADGILEGGGFAENSFLTLDGGIGFERHLNGRFSIFQENTMRINPFNRSLGPNNDRIHSLGLAAGVRMLL